MKTCENCGAKVFRLGCVNCDEANYIAEQEQLTDAQYGSDGTSQRAGSAEILSSERRTSLRPREKGI